MRKLTYDDYVKLPNDGNRYEIIDGELWVGGSLDSKPQQVFRNLFMALEKYVETTEHGDVSVVPAYIWSPAATEDEPNFIVVNTEHEVIAVEILSNDTKPIISERQDLDEAWIANPGDNSVCIRRPVGERIIVNCSLTSPLLPGFSLALKELFAEPA
jgi:Uma2 family endonuclease